MPKPVTSIINIESHNVFENPKQTSPTPNIDAPIGSILVNPRTVLRITMVRAQANEPTPTHEAEQRKQQQDGADGEEAHYVGPALGELSHHRSRIALLMHDRQPHHQQRSNHGDVANAVGSKAPALVGSGNQQACQRRPSQARYVDHG
jgi:hypothetical protein